MTSRRVMPNGDIVECGGPGRCRHCDNPDEDQVSQRNPEQDVLDAIDALVDDQLAGGPRDDYSKPYGEKCSRCGGPWHGLKRGNCPGATGITGNPEEGAKRDTDVWARQVPDSDLYPSSDNPMRRQRQAVQSIWNYIQTLIEADPTMPPGQLETRTQRYVPSERHPARQQFAVNNSVALHWDDLPPRVDIRYQDREGVGVMTLDIVTVQCAVLRWDGSHEAWEFRVATSRGGETDQRGMVVTREFLTSGFRGAAFASIPLAHLGVDAALVMTDAGTVVLDVPMPNNPDRTIRMGFLGAGGTP